MRRSIAPILILMACGALLSCQGQPKRYALRGKIVTTSPSTAEITVDHEDIPGFMSAMIMPYKVKDPTVLNGLNTGDAIEATVVVSADGGSYLLDDVRVTAAAPVSAAATVPPRALNVGARPPNVPLLNQDGKTVRLADFQGKAVLVDFIYTRCPMPEFCPRLSTVFATLHENLAKTPDDLQKTKLVSISFDPNHDTPPVLKKYGLTYLGNDPSGFAHWTFAVAKTGDLKKVAEAFGLQYYPEKDQIIHSINIVLLAPDGTIARYWGKEFTTAELESALREQASRSTANTTSHRSNVLVP